MVMATGIMVIGLIIRKFEIASYIGLGLIGLTLISGWLGKRIAWLWIKLSEVLGKVNGAVILSIIFYLFLFPISLLYRMVKKDKLGLKRKEGSYFHDRSYTYQASDFDNPW